jgi:hypothetical protein
MEFTTHISTMLSNSTTLRTSTYPAKDLRYGTITLYGAAFQRLLLRRGTSTRYRSQNYNSIDPEVDRFGLELLPLHSQLLRES